MDRDILFKAKRLDNGEWVEGSYVKSKPINEYARTEAYILDCDDEANRHLIPIDESTICHCSGKEYMDSDIAWEGDIFESQLSGDLMVLRYGTYQAFCPVDQQFMDSVGFYAECKGLPDMPIGPLKDYALKKGNIFDNPELLDILS